MRRVLLLAAAALLGSGCIVTNNDPTPTPTLGSGSVTVYWDFVRNSVNGPIKYDTALTGTTAGACPQSAVESVSIDPLDSGVPSATVSCRELNPQNGQAVQGVIIDGVPEGNRSFRIRGWRTVNGQSVAVYDSTVTVSVVANTTTYPPTAHLAPVTAPAEVFADLGYGNPVQLYASCSAASFPTLTYSITDPVGTVVATSPAAGLGCPGSLPTLVFQDLLDLDDYDVRVQGYDSSNRLVFDSCAASFAHFADDTGQYAFTATALTLPVPACP
jgi:hypothetical protein